MGWGGGSGVYIYHLTYAKHDKRNQSSMNWEKPEGLCMDKVKRKLAHRFFYISAGGSLWNFFLHHPENGSRTISLYHKEKVQHVWHIKSTGSCWNHFWNYKAFSILPRNLIISGIIIPSIESFKIIHCLPRGQCGWPDQLSRSLGSTGIYIYVYKDP